MKRQTRTNIGRNASKRTIRTILIAGLLALPLTAALAAGEELLAGRVDPEPLSLPLSLILPNPTYVPDAGPCVSNDAQAEDAPENSCLASAKSNWVGKQACYDQFDEAELCGHVNMGKSPSAYKVVWCAPNSNCESTGSIKMWGADWGGPETNYAKYRSYMWEVTVANGAGTGSKPASWPSSQALEVDFLRDEGSIGRAWGYVCLASSCS